MRVSNTLVCRPNQHLLSITGEAFPIPPGVSGEQPSPVGVGGYWLWLRWLGRCDEFTCHLMATLEFWKPTKVGKRFYCHAQG